MARKEFNIHVSMEERWIPHFQSFLKYMQRIGGIGHSALVGFYADGDGDFNPSFDFDIPEEYVEGYERDNIIEANKNSASDKVEVPNYLIPEIMFDAG